MPAIPDNFAEVIKRKTTVASLQNAVDTELARLKIEADAISRVIQKNIATMESDAKDYESLFPDIKAQATKNPDDFKAMVWLRISEHKAAQARKAEASVIRATARQAEQVNHPEMASQTPARAGAVARPSLVHIAGVVANAYGVSYSVAERWLRELFGTEEVTISLLRELYVTVMGECPSLLNEDSGGNAELAFRIENALKLK
jgi:hypothetical protein